ncbi:hypothetical protein JCM11251_004860 [Rhodosporidiobolus azoricus]
MKAHATLPLLALAASTLVTAHHSSSDLAKRHNHHLDLLAERDLSAQPNRMDRLLRNKRQIFGIPGLGSSSDDETSAAAGGASSPAAAATTPAAATSAPAAATSASPAAAATTTTSAAAQTTTSRAAQQPEAESSSSAAAAPAATTSSSSSAAAAESSSSSTTTSSSSARDRSSSSAESASTVTSTATDSAASNSSGTSSGTSSAPSSSSSADGQKKDDGEGGGIKKAVLIPIIVVASCVAAVAVIWTIIRKTKFSPSRRFEAKLEPIDFVPDHDDPAHGLVGTHHHHRNESNWSGGAGAYGNAGYAASLARSDSAGKESMRGMAMSESSHNIPSIPYNGPAYVQNPYYGAPAYTNAQPGYPHEQSYGYADLHRAGSLGPSPASPAPVQLGRMGTARSHVQQQQQQQPPAAYDYAAQARAQSRTGMRY